MRNYYVSDEQVKDIASLFGMDADNLEDWELGQLIDKLLDVALSELEPMVYELR